MSPLDVAVVVASMPAGAYLGARLTQWWLEHEEWNGGVCPCGQPWRLIGRFDKTRYYAAYCSCHHTASVTIDAIDRGGNS